MNILNKMLTRAFTVAALLAAPAIAHAQSAYLQVVHNAADPAAATVDVYVNGALALDDFAFRDATPFLELPSGVDIEVTIAPPTSTSVGDGIATFTFNLAANTNYIAVANGVLSPADFAANPDDEATAFNIFVIADVPRSASAGNKVNLNVFHGSTDAPSVDIAARAATPIILVPGAPYTASASLEVDPADYTIDIYATGTDVVAAAFDAALSGAGGASVTVIASGFYSVADNQFGPQFGLLAVFEDGTTAMLPSKTAMVQVVHNAADPAAALVDIYVNGALAIDGFAFRAATPFIELPAYLPHAVSVAPPNSNSVGDAIATIPVALGEGMSYQAVANGVLDPSAFAVNPNGVSTAFELIVLPAARTQAQNSDEVDFRVLHGASDAPAVDVRLTNGGPVLVPNAAYTDFSDYISVPAGAYTVDITLPGDANAVVATYEVDVTGLAGGSALLVASGFLSPTDNNNGQSFGVLVVLADGTSFLAPVSTSIDEGTSALPSQFELKGNYPNPFNPTTNIRYNVPVNTEVQLSVYDMLGRQVAVLVNGAQAPGSYNVSFDATNLSSGVYLYRLQAGSFSQTQKMMLVK
jgi:hypothetical protein